MLCVIINMSRAGKKTSQETLAVSCRGIERGTGALQKAANSKFNLKIKLVWIDVAVKYMSTARGYFKKYVQH